MRRWALASVGSTLRRWQWLVVVLAAVGFAAYLFWPVLSGLTIRNTSAAYAARAYETVRVSMLRGDGFPLWDRSRCAGQSFVADPIVPLVSSLFAAAGVAGERIVRLYPFVMVSLAALGASLWIRRALSASWLAAMLGGFLFASSSFFSSQGVARPWLATLGLLPWVLWLAHEGERDLRLAVLGGCVLGGAWLEGGLYSGASALMALSAMLLGRALVKPRAEGVAEYSYQRTFSSCVLVVVVAVLVAGVKLVPEILEMVAIRRQIPAETDRGAFLDLIPMLGDPDRSVLAGRSYPAAEYRNFVGTWAFGMAIAGAGVAMVLPPFRFELAFVLLFGIWLFLGRTEPVSLYGLLTAIPPFPLAKVPGRFSGLIGLGVAGCAAVAWDVAFRLVGKRRLQQAALLVVALLAVREPLLVAQRQLMPLLHPASASPHPVMAASFHLETDHDPTNTVAQGVGVVACDVDNFLPYKAPPGLSIGRVPQLTVEPSLGEIGATSVRQNLYEFEARLRAPAVVSINQSHRPGWSSSVGRVQRGATGKIEVALPAGTHKVRLAFVPPGLYLGMAATFLGLAWVPLSFVSKRRYRRGWRRLRSLLRGTRRPAR